MANHYIHVGSITNAMRGKRLLEEQGVRAYVHRNPRPSEADGCGYSLLVIGEENTAAHILQNRGVRVLRITEAL